MAEEDDVIFREEQKFSLRFMLPVVLLMILLVGASLRTIVVLNQSGSGAVWIVLFFIPFGIILPIALSILLLAITLETEVRADGLYVRYFPIHIQYKKFAPGDLGRYHARQNKPVLKSGKLSGIFGGRHKSYRVGSYKCVQFLLKNGTQLLIGSQRPYELVKAIDSIAKNG